MPCIPYFYHLLGRDNLKLQQNTEHKTHKIILSVVLYVFETWPLSLRENKVQVFEDEILRKIYELNDEVSEKFKM
jgi:hypothetical protein